MLAAALVQLASCSRGSASSSANTAGTGGTTGAPSAGSCNYPATGNCVEWTGSSWKVLTMPRLCESQKGTFLTGACPIEGRVGTCLRDQGKSRESRFLYYTHFPGYGVKLTKEAVAATGEDQCTKVMKGEWTLK